MPPNRAFCAYFDAYLHTKAVILAQLVASAVVSSGVSSSD